MSVPAQVQPHLESSVRAQAWLRVKLGLVVDALMVGTALYAGTSSPSIGAFEIVAMATVYMIYCLFVLWLVRKTAIVRARRIVNSTAVFDPLMLTCWLLLMGEASIFFACFYLFTILGFGFRIGVKPMQLCQSVSMLGLGVLVYVSPMWRAELMAAASHGLLLLIVPVYASGLIRNLHEARNHAERESRAKSQLLANVSHELRTPLTGIVSSAQLISAETRDPAVNARVEAILGLSSVLDGEIKQLLDISKMQAGRVMGAAEPFDLVEIVERVKLALEPVSMRKGIEMTVDFDGRIKDRVIGHEYELSSVLMNLAGNAVKFTDSGRVVIRIELVSERADHYVVAFRVSDTGIGIAPEHLARIFEPFYQVETGATRKYGGTGLGTSIAYEHVRRMGGELNVESEPGKGATFWFDLLLQRSAIGKDIEAHASVVEPRAEAMPPRRVLIADDHPVNLRLLHEMLAKDGHQVTAVASGEGALHCLAESDFDAIFLDFNMSDIDGASVYQLYRFGKIQTAPTFFITADTSAATSERLLATGASGLIHKPITFQKLRVALAVERGAEQVMLGDVIPAEVPEGVNATGGWTESRTVDPKDAGPTVAAGHLRLVPMEYISQDALDNLREVNPSRQFLEAMLKDAISDIEKLVDTLSRERGEIDVQEVRHIAHSLKGVCLNVGAVRLASLAGRLMTMSATELTATRQAWLRDVRELTDRSVSALNGVLQGNGSPADPG